MKRDCGIWINILSHKLKQRMNAALSDLGITGVQSRVMHYILEHYKEGPVFQKKRGRGLWTEPFHHNGYFAAIRKKRPDFPGKCSPRRTTEKPCTNRKGRTYGCPSACLYLRNRAYADKRYIARAATAVFGNSR